jgi:CBS-domain-containing membrane protein
MLPSQELEAQQADELASSDASFQQALQQLLQVWDGRINELQALLQEAEQQMVARQAQEATALLVSVHTSTCSCDYYSCQPCQLLCTSTQHV